MTGEKIFIDTSAFLGLYIADDDFHKQALQFLFSLSEKKVSFTTTNFVLDETYTFIRKRAGKKKAVEFRLFLEESIDTVRIVRITKVDEVAAWKFFQDLPGRGISFTDCTSFAVMKRLGLKEVFTFDRDFAKAGFKLFP